MATTPKQRFIDDILRRQAELVEQMDALQNVMNTEWALLSGDFADDATIYDDGRPDETLSQFPESRVHQLVAGFQSFQTNTIAPNRETLRVVAIQLPRI